MSGPKVSGQGRSKDVGKLIVVITDASYHKVMYALLMTLKAAALGVQVYIFFTYGGIMRLKRDLSDEVGLETEEWMREKVKRGVLKGSLLRISELLASLSRMGCRIYACPSAMAFHNISKDDLLEVVSGVMSPTAIITEDLLEDGLNIIYV